MEKSRYVDPFCEAGFRQIFGWEESKELLIAMLNEMMEDNRHIESIEFLRQINKEDILDGDVLLDLRCRLTGGRYLIVGLALCCPGELKKRSMVYHSQTTVKTVEAKEKEIRELMASVGHRIPPEGDEYWVKFRELRQS